MVINDIRSPADQPADHYRWHASCAITSKSSSPASNLEAVVANVMGRKLFCESKSS